jgi:hypothetical protein
MFRRKKNPKIWCLFWRLKMKNNELNSPKLSKILWRYLILLQCNHLKPKGLCFGGTRNSRNLLDFRPSSFTFIVNNFLSTSFVSGFCDVKEIIGGELEARKQARETSWRELKVLWKVKGLNDQQKIRRTFIVTSWKNVVARTRADVFFLVLNREELNLVKFFTDLKEENNSR